MVSTLRWSSTLAQGTPVARLTATDTSGQGVRLPAAGRGAHGRVGLGAPGSAGEGAPRAAPGRPHLAAAGRHAPPYPAHYYYAEFPLGATVRLRRVEVQFLHPTSQVELFGVAAFSDVSKDLEQLEPGKLGKFRRVYADDDMVLYENADYLPRAFLVPSAVVERPGDEILHRLALGDFSPERMVILEEQFDVSRLAAARRRGRPRAVRFNGPQGTEVTSGPGTVSLQEVQEDALRLRVNAQQSAMLFLADLAYPGWKAYVDGQETPIYRANYLFRSVFVPAGQHTVEFVYRPRSFRLGLLLTLVGTVAVHGGPAGARARPPCASGAPAGRPARRGFPRSGAVVRLDSRARRRRPFRRAARRRPRRTGMPDQRRTKGGASDA